MGFYPVCPGETNYVIGTPLFDRVTLRLADGRGFVVRADGNGPQRPYIRGAQLNGKPFERSFLRHDELLGGGELSFSLTSAPDYQWATAPAQRPPSAMAALLAPTR